MSNEYLSFLEKFDWNQPFEQTKEQKEKNLLEALQVLTQHHRVSCPEYNNIVAGIFQDQQIFSKLDELPFLPVRLFKTLNLQSADKAEIIKTLTSSGTTGQQVSRIYLDATTAKNQSRALNTITADFIGKKRLPMLIIDSNELLNDRKKFNARAAGILGFSIFGRKHTYCLDENLGLKIEETERFINEHCSGPTLLFGFTFIVWQQLLQQCLEQGIKLDFGKDSRLIHGGGWKKLEAQKVSNDEFKSKLREHLGIEHVHNYYGMVEQVGSIFMECEHGYLHAPSFADIIIRNKLGYKPLPFGKEGVIQLLSLLPFSYPGHSLLTEDIGIIHGEDDCACGRKGKYFSVLGRLPKAEARGCSDTRAVP